MTNQPEQQEPQQEQAQEPEAPAPEQEEPQPEEPQADALATEQEQQEPAQEPEAPATEQDAQPEEPEADALANEQQETQQEQETQQAPAPEQEPKPDPKAQKLAAEAKRYRLALRETEAKLEALEQENKELGKTLIDHALKEFPKLKLETLLKLGFTVNDLRDDNGEFPGTYWQTLRIRDFASKYGLVTGRPDFEAMMHGGTPITDEDSWDSSFKIR